MLGHYCAVLVLWAFGVLATITTTETSSTITVKNDRLAFSLTKSTGKIMTMSLDGFDLLGSGTKGLYLDCVCTPAGSYVIGSSGHTNSTLISGYVDRAGVQFAGVIVSDVYTPTNQTFKQYWFLRDGETGLHAFSRLEYFNASTPYVADLGELRTLFRPITGNFYYLSGSDHNWGALPSKDAQASWTEVQDATYYLGGTPTDPFYQEYAEYFTKYTFSESYRNTKAFGQFTNNSGTTIGAWLVQVTKEGYTGGPLHSDLTVDHVAVYDYLTSNHHGNDAPKINHGFQRTFGPKYYYFNSIAGGTHEDLRKDAEQFADPSWNAKFYDDIASLVAGYVPSSGRGTFKASFTLPSGASNALAILTASGYNHQDNAADMTAYQYWHNITDNQVEIPRVIAGNYRLTLYADGIFGEYVQDNVKVNAGATTDLNVNWVAESAGKEIFRLGTPDKSAGEFKRGNAHDPNHERHPEEYRVYWGAYSYPQDFPNGVSFTIGQSSEAEDWNYAHWSTYGGTYKDPTKYTLNPNWTIAFNVAEADLPTSTSNATFTIQLAGANTGNGNLDTNPVGFDLKVYVNNNGPLAFTIPGAASSSCVARSGVSCYNIAGKLSFSSSWLTEGVNSIILAVPASSGVSVQYDALRLEV
ncbi:galactose mutarotase-like domain-containing protein [Flagelloscypha sp. PMI_526]|nr:galactose mutarotase-like domain-containing protein [Flagelloscypha sp. PMI_526]